MPEKKHRRLVRFVRTHTGDDLRAVIRYRDDSVELLYKRDDVDADQFRDRVELTIRQAKTRDVHDGDGSSAGRTAEHVELFDGVVLVHLDEGPDEASVFSIDLDVAEEFARFLDECREVLGPQRPGGRLHAGGQGYERGSGES